MIAMLFFSALIVLLREFFSKISFWQKLTDRVEEQTKHLRNEHFTQYVDENFGKVTGRFVLYTGESNCMNEIPYLNAEKYLNRLSQFSKPPYPKLEKLFSPEKVVQTKQPKKSK